MIEPDDNIDIHEGNAFGITDNTVIITVIIMINHIRNVNDNIVIITMQAIRIRVTV